jgi:fibronectin type 3 domain-containing protein
LSLKAGSHKIYVTGFNRYGAQSEASEEYAIIVKGQDIQAPSAPSNLEAVSVSKEGIELRWTSSTGDFKSYKVYRNGKQIGDVTSPTFIDTSITAGLTYRYVVTVVDILGKESGESNSLTVTVEKEESPVLIVPKDMVVEATGARTAVNIGTAYVENMTDGVVSSNAPVDYPLGTTTVVWTVKDKEGNTLTGEQKITVIDTTPPELTVPEDKSVQATGERTSVILGKASAYDLVDGAVLVTDNAPNSYPIGTTIVTFTAVDRQGNKATKTVKVTVVKFESPVDPPVDPPVINPPVDPVIPEPVEDIPGTGGIEDPIGEEGKVEIDEGGNITIVPQADEEEKTAISLVTAQNLTDAFEKAEDDMAGIKKVTIEIEKMDGATAYEQQLPSSIFTDTGYSKKIEIATPIAVLDMPFDMFESKDIKGSESISIKVSKVDALDLSLELITQIGGRPIIQLEVFVDGKPVNWRSNKSSIKVSVDYTPTRDELKYPDRIFMWYIDDGGKLVTIPMAIYEEAAAEVTFSAKHSGRYAVAFQDKSFDDLKGYDWAKEQIEMLASRGIINGTSSTTYSPGLNITRADAVILIVKALGLEAEFGTNFDDVSPEKYYYEAIGVARSLGIITGVGDNKFNPETPITRQELMVIVNRALETVGISLNGMDASELEEFKDASEISSYAIESVSALVKEGIIKGDDNKLIAPLRNITRAETAIIIYKSFDKVAESL